MTQPIATSPGNDITPLLVAYDIADNKRRNRLHRLLRGFGEPLQKSVFMCWVDSRRRQRLQTLLEDFRCKAHTGQERIACIEARPSGLEKPVTRLQWIWE